MRSSVRVWATEIGRRGTIVVRWESSDGLDKGQETVGKITGRKRDDAKIRQEAEARVLELRRYFELPPEDTKEEDARVSWSEAKRRYESEYLPRNSRSNANVWKVAAAGFQESMKANKRSLADVSTIRLKDIEAYRTSLLGSVSESSANTYINTLRAGFAWFSECEWRDPLPAKRRGRSSKSKMKGRPLTREEIERLCATVPAIIKTSSVQQGWTHWIEGLYLSGLRLEESLFLSWDDPTMHRIRLGRIPKINFAPSQKNGEVQVIATAPDFAAFLAKTPKADRHGFVFNPMTRSGRIRNEKHASRRISEIGERAGIHTQPGKTASAHDLRRSFGSRWSLLVMPPVLQHMMRHVSIETTMRYYVDHTADLLGREIKEAFEQQVSKMSVTSVVTPESAGRAIADAVKG